MININKIKKGVYKIFCLPTEIFYIGSSKNLLVRESDHFRDLRNNRHPNKHLQRAWNKYGEENFIWSVLEECPIEFIKEQILEREQHYLDTLLFAQEYIRKEDKRFLELGFNLNPVAGAGTGENLKTIWKGRKLTREHIENRQASCKKTIEERKKDTLGWKRRYASIRKIIVKYDKNTFEILCRYSGAKELKEGSNVYSSMCERFRNGINTGFAFETEFEKFLPKVKEKLYLKNIIQYDIVSFDIIREYNSIEDCLSQNNKAIYNKCCMFNKGRNTGIAYRKDFNKKLKTNSIGDKEQSIVQYDVNTLSVINTFKSSRIATNFLNEKFQNIQVRLQHFSKRGVNTGFAYESDFNKSIGSLLPS